MILGLFRRKPVDATYTVYGAIVAQARQPVFYLDFGVPDTVTARFDMIVAHVVPFFTRLEGEGEVPKAAAQAVLDLFFRDMDRSLRDMGVGDTRVPKKMKTIASAYLGRAQAYAPALASGDLVALTDAVARNVFSDAPDDLASAALARYMLATRVAFAAANLDMLLAGTLPWPDAATFAPVRQP